MACIIPRRPWLDASLRPGPAAGELSWDATSELGMMLMLSEVEALSRMLGSVPFRQLKVFRLLWGGGTFNSEQGAKKKHLNFKLLPLKCFSGKLNGWTCTCYHYVSTRKLLPVQPANERMSSFLLTRQLIFCRVETRWKVKARAECFIFNFLCLGLERG